MPIENDKDIKCPSCEQLNTIKVKKCCKSLWEITCSNSQCPLKKIKVNYLQLSGFLKRL